MTAAIGVDESKFITRYTRRIAKVNDDGSTSLIICNKELTALTKEDLISERRHWAEEERRASWSEKPKKRYPVFASSAERKAYKQMQSEAYQLRKQVRAEEERLRLEMLAERKAERESKRMAQLEKRAAKQLEKECRQNKRSKHGTNHQA